MKCLRFIKITTSHTEFELSNMFSVVSVPEIEQIQKIYNKFDKVEYIDNDFVCMFASIHSNYINDLINLYVKFNISFTYEDFTKKALFGLMKSKNKNVNKLISKFIEQNLEVDDVLDKINELGMKKLNEKDLLVLKNA